LEDRVMDKPSPLQNRVTPTGEIVAIGARGGLMGNRGILHDDAYRILSARWKHPHWVTCVLDFKDRRRPVMQAGNYTELFFTDEAVALAAGHRPCAECRRADFKRFQSAFGAAHPDCGAKPAAPVMDRILHAARVHSRTRRQITHRAVRADLPDGVFYRAEGRPEAIVNFGGASLAWSSDGYTPCVQALPLEVEVLTPEPTVRTIRAGYVVGRSAS
jgi:hypothetical protein